MAINGIEFVLAVIFSLLKIFNANNYIFFPIFVEKLYFSIVVLTSK